MNPRRRILPAYKQIVLAHRETKPTQVLAMICHPHSAVWSYYLLNRVELRDTQALVILVQTGRCKYGIVTSHPPHTPITVPPDR